MILVKTERRLEAKEDGSAVEDVDGLELKQEEQSGRVRSRCVPWRSRAIPGRGEALRKVRIGEEALPRGRES